jgi:hypothetical protein
MTVTAAARPPRPSEPVERDELEALIERRGSARGGDGACTAPSRP